ncbi:hypothetical protein [Streptomyces sp. NPDC089799]|uniref:hypothetical protein n=1 Tax=Streptomyces sp. NPDC089799 TaxID=3155066 RepID=UPI00342CABB1
MLEPELVELATLAGAAVVQAAGTDLWSGMRQAVAGWFARGDGGRERAALDRLDETATALDSAEGTDTERVCLRHETAWQTRVETLLEDLDDAERARAAEALRTLLARYRPPEGPPAARGGLTAGGDVRISARDHSAAAGIVHGDVSVSHPRTPDPDRG